MREVTLPGGEAVPALGLGTWRLGEAQRTRADEVRAVQFALDLGYRLIDTAEMYGDAEVVVGEALAGRRDGVFVVSKVLPSNASRRGTVSACERSLKRLRTDRLDLYLLHWRGDVPLAETVAAFEQLQSDGKIRHWGVSNFDVADMEELWDAGGEGCAANQVWYSASRRGIEFDLAPWQRARGVATMAYSPIDQGALAKDRALGAVGQRRGATAAQVALAWVMAQPGTIAIPKALREPHLRDNLAAAALTLTAADLAQIDRAFPPPRRKTALAIT